jgi:hypothetical protein
LLVGLPTFITLNAETKKFLVKTNDENDEGSYQIVLAKNINGANLFSSFKLKVVVDRLPPNGYL